MKKTKEQPSLAGLLLIVTGMLLISIILLNLTANRSPLSLKVSAGLGCAAVASLVVGATLSSRKRK